MSTRLEVSCTALQSSLGRSGCDGSPGSRRGWGDRGGNPSETQHQSGRGGSPDVGVGGLVVMVLLLIPNREGMLGEVCSAFWVHHTGRSSTSDCLGPFKWFSDQGKSWQRLRDA